MAEGYNGEAIRLEYPLANNKTATVLLTAPDAREVAYLFGLTEKMRKSLAKAFPDCWAVIYTLVMLPVLHGRQGRHGDIEEQYRHSSLSQIFSNLTLDKDSLSGFFSAISMDRFSMESYFADMQDASPQIALINGHGRSCILRKSNRAIRLCSQSKNFPGIPRYYRQTYGMEDCLAYVRTISQNTGISLEKITVVVDQKDLSSEDAENIGTGPCKYVLGLQPGIRELRKVISSEYSCDGSFSYRSREIKYCTVKSEGQKAKTVIYQIEGPSRTTEEYLDREEDKWNFRKDALWEAGDMFDQAKTASIDADQQLSYAKGDQMVTELSIRNVKENILSKKERLQRAQDSLKAAKPEKQEHAEGVAARAAEKLKQEEAVLKDLETRYQGIPQKVAARKQTAQHARRHMLIAEWHFLRCQIAVETSRRLLDAAYENAKWWYMYQVECQDLDHPQQDHLIFLEDRFFILQTNRIELSAEEIYHLFQQGLVRREYWTACDTILGLNTSYVRHPDGEEAWLFFQHLSATMAALALQDLLVSGQWKDGLFIGGLVELVASLHIPEKPDIRYVSPISENILDNMPL